MRRAGIALLIVLLLGGCSQKQKGSEAHTEEPVGRTVWSTKTELFMEYDEPKAGDKAGFLVHLTDLKDFKPITEGQLTMTFTPETGEAVVVKIDKPERPGIFRADVPFTHPGNYVLKVALAGRTVSDVIEVPDIEVGGEKPTRDEGRHHERGGADISFLKEQQWTVDFMVGVPSKRSISSSFIATGEIMPVATAQATVSAPLTGIVSLTQKLPFAGKKVSAGEVLAVIEPPVGQQGGMGTLAASHAEARNKVILAQKELERARRLYEVKAVAKRRVEEAEIALQGATAAFEPLDRAMREVEAGGAGNKVIIRAPFGGTVVEVLVVNGKAIEAGQPLLKIIDTALVWLRANVPATEVGVLTNLETSTFTVPGIQGELKPSRLVAVNDVVDPKTRTVPVIFELNNNGGRLKVGMFADVSVRTGHVENAMTLPDEALFEDEGRFFVYVQKEGESFERREVKTGLRGSGFAQILSGLKEDERVVLKGGYYVKLASLSSRTAQGHGHDH